MAFGSLSPVEFMPVQQNRPMPFQMGGAAPGARPNVGAQGMDLLKMIQGGGAGGGAMGAMGGGGGLIDILMGKGGGGPLSMGLLSGLFNKMGNGGGAAAGGPMNILPPAAQTMPDPMTALY